MSARDTVTAPTGHVPALDGVRGIAVLLVMWYHLSIVPRSEQATARLDDWYQALAFTGWAGVDLFFVLSGFLITGILLRTRDSANYFRAFYARRALRIFPLYYAVLAGVLFVLLPAAGALQGRVSALSAVTSQLSGLRDHQAWFWLYASNIYTFVHDGQKAVPGMGHFWSLAIEEQYYLVWSPLVFFCGPRRLAAVCVAVIAGATACRIVMIQSGTPFYSIQTFTLTRVDSIVFGSLGACAMHLGIPRSLGVVFRRVTLPCWAGAVAVQVAWGSTMDRALSLAVSPTMFAAVFLITVLGIASAEPTARRGVLTNRFLVHLGTISYGLYVFHVPIRGVLLPLYERLVPQTLLLGSQMPWTLGFVALTFLVSLAVAEISWFVFESRILRLKKYVPYAAKSTVPGVVAP